MKKLPLMLSLLLALFASISVLLGFFIFKNNLVVKKTSAQSNQNTVLGAIALLPNTSDITQIQKIKSSLFWILRDTAADKLENGIDGGRRYESWMVNTDAQIAALGQARNRFDGFFVSAIRKSGSGFFEVHHEQAGWDEIVDYYDALTGALKVSTNWDHYFYIERGNTINVTKDGKTVEISFAPPLDFKGDLKNEEECNKVQKVTVDALVVNGKPIKFKKHHSLNYEPAYSHSECVGWNYPDFGRPVFDGKHTVYFNLPWNEQVTVDIDHLDITGVSVNDKPSSSP